MKTPINTDPFTNAEWLAHWMLVNRHSHQGCGKTHKTVQSYQTCIGKHPRAKPAPIPARSRKGPPLEFGYMGDD